MLGPTPEPGAIPQNIPVNIGIGWGIIIYVVKLFSDNLGLSLWSRPPLDALLALNVDLSMDAVAYRLNMWHWGWEFLPSQPDPLASEWFGIPYANFYGWLSVIFFYSAFARLLLGWQSNKRFQWLRNTVSVVAAIILAQVCLYLCIRLLPGWISDIQEILFSFYVQPFVFLTVSTLIVFVGAAILGLKRRQTPERVDDHPVIWLVPTYFHVYFITWLFIAGFYRETFWLPAVSVMNAIVGVLLHQWGRFIRKKTEMSVMPGTAIES
jgi:hypothetical protein